MGQSQFEDFLEAISVCFVEKDFETWNRRVVFPLTLITSAGPVILRDETDLRYNFALYLKACTVLKLDQIHRKPVQLEECSDGSWIGTYETSLLCHGARVIAPYTSSALLHDRGGLFKMSAIMNARGHHDWTGHWPDEST